MNKKATKIILRKGKIGNIKAFIFLSCCLSLCSCGIFKKDMIKVGEGVEIVSEIVDGTGKELETVGKEIEEVSSKFKDKTLDEHADKYLVEELKEDQKCVGNKSRANVQTQKK
jgi:hypothetical protein